MWDRQTQSWWQQLTGEAIAGELAGARLSVVPAQIVSWSVFAGAYPDGLVLDRPTASGRYGSNPYVGYDALNSHPFLYPPPTDPRLPPKERVAAVEINGQAAAFPYSRLAEERVVHSEVGGEPVVVFFQFGATSALGAASIAQAADVGSTGVFRPGRWTGARSLSRRTMRAAAPRSRTTKPAADGASSARRSAALSREGNCPASRRKTISGSRGRPSSRRRRCTKGRNSPCAGRRHPAPRALPAYPRRRRQPSAAQRDPGQAEHRRESAATSNCPLAGSAINPASAAPVAPRNSSSVTPAVTATHASPAAICRRHIA